MDDFKRNTLLDNPDLFILHYFPHRIEKLEGFHRRLIDTALTQERGLVLYPAGHGKTTLVSTLLPIWAICNDPNIRIAVIAKNEADGQGIMRVIQAELSTNDELIRDFGPFRDEESDKPWALGRLEIAKRTRKAKESTITVFGSGAKTVLGHRTDWTICDDVITEKNSATPTMRNGIREWFDLAVETGPEFEDSRCTVVGTLFHPEDLYNDLMVMTDPEDGLPIWHVQREDAIVEMCSCGLPVSDHPVEKCNGPYPDDMAHATLWPARWPWKRLMRQKAKVGTLNFNKRYRNIAVDPSRQIFREEYVKGGYVGPLGIRAAWTAITLSVRLRILGFATRVLTPQ